MGRLLYATLTKTLTAHYRPSKFKDCRNLAPIIRDTDKREIWASHGLTPLAGLQLSFLVSEECNSVVNDNQDIIGMFGVTNNGTVGVPWLLMSEASEGLSFNREFVTQNKQWVTEVQKRYQVLTNFVSQENKRAIKWLKILGFTFISLKPNYGVHPQPFYEFVRIRS